MCSICCKNLISSIFRKDLMQQDGWIDLLSAFAQDLVIIEEMTLLHLHWIQISQYFHSSCSTWGAHNLYRYLDYLQYNFIFVILFWHWHLQYFFSFLQNFLNFFSQFLCQVFNNSPDETAYFRMMLNRESISNSVVMIQPSLLSYSFNSPPVPALLDVASISADRILLLDAYFSVVIFHGMTIAQWRNMGYQNQPEHQVIRLDYTQAFLLIRSLKLRPFRSWNK